MNIIFFNGPPSSGKDTAAMHIFDELYDFSDTYRFDRMSMPSKRAFAGAVNARIDEFGNVEDWESRKDEPSELLAGYSYRQWQIHFSENFMKPLFGNDIFARLFTSRHAHRSADSNYTVLVPDCGFPVEAAATRKAFPNAKICIIRIFRPGTDYTSDSRAYLLPSDPSIKEAGNIDFIDVFNNRSISEFHKKVEPIVRNFIQE